jgi:hypothetical protein
VLGIGGKFTGSKGMVAMPDLSNRTPEEALSLLAQAGLSRKSLGSSSTSNSSLNNKTFGQSVSAGSLVDYETRIDYSYYIYVAPPTPAAPPPPVPYLFGGTYLFILKTDFECPGEGWSVPYEIREYRTNYYLNGSPTGGYIVNVSDKIPYYTGAPAQRSGVCGYVAPPPPPAAPPCSPSFSVVSSWTGSCSGGTQLTATRYRNSCTGAENVVSGSQSCCTPTTEFVSSWSGSCVNGVRASAVRYRNSCTGATWVSNSYASCGPPPGAQ